MRAAALREVPAVVSTPPPNKAPVMLVTFACRCALRQVRPTVVQRGRAHHQAIMTSITCTMFPGGLDNPPPPSAQENPPRCTHKMEGSSTPTVPDVTLPPPPPQKRSNKAQVMLVTIACWCSLHQVQHTLYAT
jgi:hypothetical protein